MVKRIWRQTRNSVTILQLLLLFWLIDFFSCHFISTVRANSLLLFQNNPIKWLNSLTQIIVCSCYIACAAPFSAGNYTTEYWKWRFKLEHSAGVIICRQRIPALISLFILFFYYITLVHQLQHIFEMNF